MFLKIKINNNKGISFFMSITCLFREQCFSFFFPVFTFHFRTQEISILGLQQKLTWTLGSCFIQCLGLLVQSLKLKPSTYLKGMIKITAPYKKRKEIIQLNDNMAVFIFFNGKIT